MDVFNSVVHILWCTLAELWGKDVLSAIRDGYGVLQGGCPGIPNVDEGNSPHLIF